MGVVGFAPVVVVEDDIASVLEHVAVAGVVGVQGCSDTGHERCCPVGINHYLARRHVRGVDIVSATNCFVSS
jgi:hypothetical protein